MQQTRPTGRWGKPSARTRPTTSTRSGGTLMSSMLDGSTVDPASDSVFTSAKAPVTVVACRAAGPLGLGGGV